MAILQYTILVPIVANLIKYSLLSMNAVLYVKW